MTEHLFFPMYVDISKMKIVMFGAGSIAARRAVTLLCFTDQLTIVAPEATEEIKSSARQGKIIWMKDVYREEYLQDADIVFGATDDRACNQKIADDCNRLRIPVNICDEKERCDFQFPAVVVKDDVVIGVNAGGRDHRKVKETRIKIEEMLKQEENA